MFEERADKFKKRFQDHDYDSFRVFESEVDKFEENLLKATKIIKELKELMSEFPWWLTILNKPL